MAIQTADNILDSVRSRLPGVGDDQIKLEVFNTVSELCVEALSIGPPEDPDSDYWTWLNNDQWLANYRAVLDGTLFRLYAQVGKPWSNKELAAAHAERYMSLLSLSRTDAAAGPPSVSQRLLNAIRVQLPQARESAVTLAAFAIANKIRLDALRLPVLTDTDTTVSLWLPDWPAAYQAMYYGTLSRLQEQVAQPWSNPQAAATNQGLFLEELIALRGEQSEATAYGMSKLMDLARARLPSARDNIIQLELFAVMNEFFQQTSCWMEDIEVDVIPTTSSYIEDPDAYTYSLIPLQGSIVRLMYLRDSGGLQKQASMQTPGTIVLQNASNVADTYVATVAKTVSDPTSNDGYPQFPDWVLDKYNNELLDGLLGRMMSQLAKPYSSPQMAQYHLKSFKSGISRAYVETLHGNVYRAQNWRFPQTFARRRRYNGF